VVFWVLKMRIFEFLCDRFFPEKCGVPDLPEMHFYMLHLYLIAQRACACLLRAALYSVYTDTTRESEGNTFFFFFFFFLLLFAKINLFIYV